MPQTPNTKFSPSHIILPILALPHKSGGWYMKLPHTKEMLNQMQHQLGQTTIKYSDTQNIALIICILKF